VSAAGAALSRFRIPEQDAVARPSRRPPPAAWSFLHGLKSPLSSTALRTMRRKDKGGP
jgi:nicotinate-nucleotide adenylyltransferase